MRPRLLCGLALLLAATQLLSSLPAADGQGLSDGGVLGGQTCDAARLQQFDGLLALADEYAGSRSRGRGGSGSSKPRPRPNGRRHLLQGLADAPLSVLPVAAGEVQAAGAPNWRTNQTCTSASGADMEAAFHVASAPAVFLAPTPTVRDQGDECASCVGFSLASCAEASLAAFTGTAPTDVSFSPRSLYYCGGGGRVCGTAWTVAAGAAAVVAEPDVLRNCRDVDDIKQGSAVGQACDAARSRCSSTDPPAPVCTDVKAIASIWEVQRHIREHGSVVTRLNVNNPRNFTEFFEANRTGIFPGSSACEDWPSCGQPFGHATTLIGYDNTAMAWTVLNSWGPDWADRGTFRIAYGIAGVGNAPDTYGLVCRPADIQVQRALRLPLVHTNATCYTYTVDAARTPSLSSVATRFGVSIVQLVADNPGVFPRVRHTYNGSWAPPQDGSAPECAAMPNCGATMEPECLLEVVNAADGSDTCTMTWLQPNLTMPLHGVELLLCNVPPATFAGSADGRFAGTAVAVCPAGQQPNDAGSCETCPPGTFKEQAGTGDCSVCPANTIRTAADSPAGPCRVCPGSGVTRPGGTAWDHDSADDCGCPAGQTLGGSGSQCVTCPANTFKEQAGPGGCEDCPYGSLALGSAPSDHDNGTEDCTRVFKTIAAGSGNACALTAAGSRLVCWGNNFDGELQLAKQRPSASWSGIALGDRFGCGVLGSSGRLVCLGTNAPPTTPQHASTKWAAIEVGWGRLCAIAQGSRRLACFGDNDNGQSTVPAAHRNASWAAVSTGALATCGILQASGRLVCFGDRCLTVPAAHANAAWAAVSVSDGHACGLLRASRRMVCWGDEFSASATDVPKAHRASRWAAVAAGSASTCGILADSGELVCWGGWIEDALRALPVDQRTAKWTAVSGHSEICGILANGRLLCFSRSTLTPPPAREPPTWVAVSAGGAHSCGITGAGRLLCWGARGKDTLGRSVEYGQASVPAQHKDAQWAAVSCGDWHSCGLLAGSGRLVCWGSNTVPESASSLGEGLFFGQATVPPQHAFASWVAVACGAAHTCSIKADGELVCFGNIFNGEATVPAEHRRAKWVAVSAGVSFTCAILADTRRLVCFGWNLFDQATVPAKHQNARWAAIGAGSEHACGILESGRMVCWGSSADEATAVPTVNSTTARWVAVSAGYEYSCGVLRDSDALGVSRQLLCWGRNGLSQAASLNKLDSVLSVAAGWQHSCYILSASGQLVCRGNNANGQTDVPRVP